MELNWLESIIYGFIYGITEILPLSAPAHEVLVSKVFGISSNPMLQLFVHAAILGAIYWSMKEHIDKLMQEQKLYRIPPKRRPKQPDAILVREYKLLRSAVIFMILGFCAGYFFRNVKFQLSLIAGLLFLNGIILYIPGRLPSGNKDSRLMTPVDSVLLGFAAALAMFPGLSRMGTTLTTAQLKGVDKDHALRWAFLLNMIALVFVIGMDFYFIILNGFGQFSISNFIVSTLAAACAFGTATAGLSIMRFLAFRAGFSSFAYYSWGAALFAFLMYLTS